MGSSGRRHDRAAEHRSRLPYQLVHRRCHGARPDRLEDGVASALHVACFALNGNVRVALGQQLVLLRLDAPLPGREAPAVQC